VDSPGHLTAGAAPDWARPPAPHDRPAWARGKPAEYGISRHRTCSLPASGCRWRMAHNDDSPGATTRPGDQGWRSCSARCSRTRGATGISDYRSNPAMRQPGTSSPFLRSLEWSGIASRSCAGSWMWLRHSPASSRAGAPQAWRRSGGGRSSAGVFGYLRLGVWFAGEDLRRKARRPRCALGTRFGGDRPSNSFRGRTSGNPRSGRKEIGKYHGQHPLSGK
jgi:hypothetical protein